LIQAATFISFRFLVVMLFAGFSGIIFGESPGYTPGFDPFTVTAEQNP
jgi:hypothetical protein